MPKNYGYFFNLTLWIYNFSPMPLENEGNPEGLQLLRESLRKVQLESPDKVRASHREVKTDSWTYSRQTDRHAAGWIPTDK